ncbi:pyridoxal phosphate-dependent transferase [Kickxella alabastrina]|uniref:pyridoxal phosphate-dependent transferase n=1 Tax=Kickxella alabastrina TaxID=61397 RepID=UPI002220EDF8|nr:pyridoxal phosphate-dependent transferase [Kickxella alabastrina]KAI7825858.1 pyridoxal phosphate-dependent transferase [Kickxella alabastrina]KAJ1942678.1 hypothetical protein GGF37_003005 [Kickxella alabastrina]
MTSTKPHSKDLSVYFTESAKQRDNSPLKSLMKYMSADPALVSLGAGLPHPSTFPLGALTTLVAQPGHMLSECAHPPATSIQVNQPTSKTEGLERFLQYGNGRGVPSYSAFARTHTASVHNPPYADWDVVPSVGNTDAFVKALMLFCDRGDTLVVDEWTYPAILGTVGPMGIRVASVRMDAEGAVPEDLDRVCGENRVRVAYMIPTAQNPTGATMSLERKRAVYAVAQKHDLVLIEDDPYYYLQFGAYEEPAEGVDRLRGLPGIKGLIPSLLSLDTDGRVIRLDSFSKILAPGLRCGWVTAPRYIADKIQFHNETTVQQPSGLSQALVSKLLNEDWGHSGWESHLLRTQREYAVRRDVFVDLCREKLKGLAEFTVPQAGMFLWFRIVLPPQLEQRQGVMDEVFARMIEKHVLLVPGRMFSAKGVDGPYMRAAFSYASVEDLGVAVDRLREALLTFQQEK